MFAVPRLSYTGETRNKGNTSSPDEQCRLHSQGGVTQRIMSQVGCRIKSRIGARLKETEGEELRGQNPLQKTLIHSQESRKRCSSSLNPLSAFRFSQFSILNAHPS